VFRKLVLATCVTVAGCSEASRVQGSPEAGVDAGTEGTPACGAELLEPGDHLIGAFRTRQYIVHVPPHEPGERLPLVFNMHGFAMQFDQQPQISRMDEAADERGYVVVYPSGTTSFSAFNAGDCCTFNDKNLDDVGYIVGLIDEVGASLCIDRDRVYASGFSNGGFMAYRLACEAPEHFAAIGSVSGVLGIPPETCNPDHALPAIHLHGTADLIVPYDGGSPAGFSLFFPGAPPPQFRSVAETVAFYRMLSGCEPNVQVVLDEADTRCLRYAMCDPGSEITLCTIEGGGHSWPGCDEAALQAALQSLAFALGTTSHTINGSRTLLEFFDLHRRR